MGQLNILQEKFWDFIGKTREEFSSEEYEEKAELKWWDVCILCLGGYLKEIIELFLSTFLNKPNIQSLIKTPPFNEQFIWILILKAFLGGLLLIYFGFRLSRIGASHLTSWYVFIFISWSILRMCWVLIPRAEIQILLQLFLLFFYFWFFFIGDNGNLNSWKLVFYEKNNLRKDNFGEILQRRPGTHRSREKMKKITTIILSFFILMVFCNFIGAAIIKAIKTSDRAGEGPIDIRPKNQKMHEDSFRENWFFIAVSAIFMAPITEELIFRKCLMKLGNNKFWMALLSGFLFSLMHLKSGESFVVILNYLMNGTILSLMVWMSKNIWFSIFSHSLWNAVGVLHLFIKLFAGDI